MALSIISISHMAILVGNVAPSESPAAVVDDSVIVINERGVARQQEATKKIYCEDVQWHLSWKSDKKGELVEVKIDYFSSAKVIELRDAAAELRLKTMYLDSVSASCNPSDGHMPTKSNLLLLATDKQTGEDIWGVLAVDPRTIQAEWKFAPRE